MIIALASRIRGVADPQLTSTVTHPAVPTQRDNHGPVTGLDRSFTSLESPDHHRQDYVGPRIRAPVSCRLRSPLSDSQSFAYESGREAKRRVHCCCVVRGLGHQVRLRIAVLHPTRCFPSPSGVRSCCDESPACTGREARWLPRNTRCRIRGYMGPSIQH